MTRFEMELHNESLKSQYKIFNLKVKRETYLKAYVIAKVMLFIIGVFLISPFSPLDNFEPLIVRSLIIFGYVYASYLFFSIPQKEEKPLDYSICSQDIFSNGFEYLYIINANPTLDTYTTCAFNPLSLPNNQIELDSKRILTDFPIRLSVKETLTVLEKINHHLKMENL